MDPFDAFMSDINKTAVAQQSFAPKNNVISFDDINVDQTSDLNETETQEQQIDNGQ